jgi:NAD-dependent DNA ligase
MAAIDQHEGVSDRHYERLIARLDALEQKVKEFGAVTFSSRQESAGAAEATI